MHQLRICKLPFKFDPIAKPHLKTNSLCKCLCLVILLPAVLTPTPFKTATLAVLNGNPRHFNFYGPKWGVKMARPFKMASYIPSPFRFLKCSHFLFQYCSFNEETNSISMNMCMDSRKEKERCANCNCISSMTLKPFDRTFHTVFIIKEHQ